MGMRGGLGPRALSPSCKHVAQSHRSPFLSVSALQEHPLDSKDEEGQPFWTGDRRVPTPAAFDPRNRLHVDFLLSATLLKARVLNVLDSRKNVEDIEQMALAVVNEILPGYQVRAL